MMRSIRMLGMLLWRDQKDVWHSARDSVINSSILFFFQAIQFLKLYNLKYFLFSYFSIESKPLQNLSFFY